MAKRIVICMDGTWQNLATTTKLTNVGRVALDVKPMGEDGVQQLVHYSPGIGAESFLAETEDRIFKGATGQGAEEQIISAYLFLSLNFAMGDHIYLFGFSRGAFCARSLAGLIRACGIIKREHASRVREAFKLYQRNVNTDAEAAAARAKFREAYAIAPVYEMERGDDNHPHASYISYVGVFDTVVMRGLIKPQSQSTVGKRFAFHDLRLGTHVRAARQALAIDERRQTLRPTYWGNLSALNVMAGFDPNDPEAPYQQKWFTGAHGDVGGGESDELSEVSRKWIKRGAKAAGLDFDGEPLEITPQQGGFAFLQGQIEEPKGFLNIAGFFDRSLFPEPVDPSELPDTMMAMVVKAAQDMFKPKAKPSAEDILRLSHGSALLRAFQEGRNPPYAPKTLQPLLRALEDPELRAKVLERAQELM